LSSLVGINQGETNLLSWITNSELNNDYFTIERSINGYEWEYVGTVEGAGTSQHSKYYELVDEDPNFPVTYYRLSQTDCDGEVTFYEVISVNGQKQSAEFVSALFPNPAEKYSTFVYDGNNTKDLLNVKVLDNLGSVVMEMDYKVYSGMPQTLRTDKLAYGMYNIVFTQGDQQSVQKLSVLK